MQSLSFQLLGCECRTPLPLQLCWLRSRDGRFLVTRDYLSVKIWDVAMERAPAADVFANGSERDLSLVVLGLKRSEPHPQRRARRGPPRDGR